MKKRQRRWPLKDFANLVQSEGLLSLSILPWILELRDLLVLRSVCKYWQLSVDRYCKKSNLFPVVGKQLAQLNPKDTSSSLLIVVNLTSNEAFAAFQKLSRYSKFRKKIAGWIIAQIPQAIPKLKWYENFTQFSTSPVNQEVVDYRCASRFSKLTKLHLLEVDMTAESLKEIINNEAFQNNMTNFALILIPEGKYEDKHTLSLFEPIIHYKKLEKLYMGDWHFSSELFEKLTSKESFQQNLKTLLIYQIYNNTPDNRLIHNFGLLGRLESLQELYILNTVITKAEWKKITSSPVLQKNLKALHLFLDHESSELCAMPSIEDIKQFKNLTVYSNANGFSSVMRFVNDPDLQASIQAVSLIDFCALTLDMLVNKFTKLKAVFIFNNEYFEHHGITSDDTNEINLLIKHRIDMYSPDIFIIPYSFFPESHKYL